MSAPGAARWRPGDPVEPLRRILGRGGVLAIPTESSYGLAVDPMNPRAVELVFDIKRRAPDQPLPIVVSDFRQIRALGAELPRDLETWLESVWPAALTVLLPVAGRVPAAAGSSRLAFRIPAHALLRDLLGRLGLGLTATSANRSGEPPLLDPESLGELLAGRDAAIVDGGVLAGGPPSTIVGWRDGRLEVVRAGSYPVDQSISFSAPSVEISVEDGA